jgi:uncharacterized membrane protein (DUF2068 family)
MNSVKHIARILLAYAVSCLVTGYVVWGSLFWDEVSDKGFRAPGFGLFIVFLVAWFAAAPASLTVLVGEAKRWRMPWYYALAGSLIGLGLGTLFNSTWYFPWLGVSFGLVSGAIFWAIGGRHAGPADPGDRRLTLIAMAVILVLALAFATPLLSGFRQH